MTKHLLTLAALASFATAGIAADAQAPAKETTPCTAADCKVDACKAPAIAKADLEKAIADKAVTLIDCNGSDSFAKGRLPGAIDLEASKADLAAKLPKDKAALVVVYCGGVKCGAWKSGCAAVSALGYTNVKHFPEGLAGWDAAKLER
jgi:rhodanese-related sulfurtransferase